VSELLVVGSIALDTVTTPAGRVEETLGGSAVYFSCAASFFCPVRLVGVVGEDFPQANLEFLEDRSVDLSGVRCQPGKTFRWSGSYRGDMSEATTEWVELNVFDNFRPDVPESFRSSEFVFLANGDPKMQLHLLDQLEQPCFAACDTMDHWIESDRQPLLDVLGRVDGTILNGGEATLLTGEANLVKAGRAIREMGPRVVVIKKGPHGSAVFAKEGYFVAPAYPVVDVVDPTGAGDSFAGGLMGYLAAKGSADWATVKRAVLLGTAAASFSVEGFSLDGLTQAKLYDVVHRSEQLQAYASV